MPKKVTEYPLLPLFHKFIKGAKSIKDLGSKKTRSGTYDANLNRIGD